MRRSIRAVGGAWLLSLLGLTASGDAAALPPLARHIEAHQQRVPQSDVRLPPLRLSQRDEREADSDERKDDESAQQKPKQQLQITLPHEGTIWSVDDQQEVSWVKPAWVKHVDVILIALKLGFTPRRSLIASKTPLSSMSLFPLPYVRPDLVSDNESVEDFMWYIAVEAVPSGPSAQSEPFTMRAGQPPQQANGGASTGFSLKAGGLGGVVFVGVVVTVLLSICCWRQYRRRPHAGVATKPRLAAAYPIHEAAAAVHLTTPKGPFSSPRTASRARSARGHATAAATPAAAAAPMSSPIEAIVCGPDGGGRRAKGAAGAAAPPSHSSSLGSSFKWPFAWPKWRGELVTAAAVASPGSYAAAAAVAQPLAELPPAAAAAAVAAAAAAQRHRRTRTFAATPPRAHAAVRAHCDAELGL